MNKEGLVSSMVSTRHNRKDFKITDWCGFSLIRGGIKANQVSYQSLMSHLSVRIKKCMPWPEYILPERFKTHKGLMFFPISSGRPYF